MTRVVFWVGKISPRTVDLDEEARRTAEIARLLRVQAPLAKLLDRPLASYRLEN